MLPATDPYGHPITWPSNVNKYLIKEANPLLPKYPSQKIINLVFIGSALSHIVITHYLSHEGRIYWQTATLSIELWVVNSNYNLGVAIKF